MNRKILMKVASAATAVAFGCAFAISAVFSFPAIQAKAQGLTQTTDASKVSYGVLSSSDIEILRAVFNVDYYMKANPELVEKYGNNYDAYFEHFYKYGIFEGRTCNENFDPAAYASAYSDLKEAFGTDIMSYYKFYVTEGKNDPNRQITTLKACAENGITVTSLVDPESKITPQLYAVAEKFKTNNFEAVNYVVKQAIIEAAAVGGTAVISNGEESVVIRADENGAVAGDDEENENGQVGNQEANVAGDDEENENDQAGNQEANGNEGNGNNQAASNREGYTLVKTISLSNSDNENWPSDGIDIRIYKGNTSGYGAWTYEFTETVWDDSYENMIVEAKEEYKLVNKTEDYDYEGDETLDGANVDMGTQVAYIPVYVRDAHNTDDAEFDQGTPTIMSEEEYNSSTVTELITSGSAEEVQGTNVSGDIENDYDIVIDTAGTTDTQYNVEVAFGDGTNDETLEVSVSVTSEDGDFEMESSYTIDPEAEPNDFY